MKRCGVGDLQSPVCCQVHFLITFGTFYHFNLEYDWVSMVVYSTVCVCACAAFTINEYMLGMCLWSLSLINFNIMSQRTISAEAKLCVCSYHTVWYFTPCSPRWVSGGIFFPLFCFSLLNQLNYSLAQIHAHTNPLSFSSVYSFIFAHILQMKTFSFLLESTGCVFFFHCFDIWSLHETFAILFKKHFAMIA